MTDKPADAQDMTPVIKLGEVFRVGDHKFQPIEGKTLDPRSLKNIPAFKRIEE